MDRYYPLFNNTFYVHPVTGILEYSGKMQEDTYELHKVNNAHGKMLYRLPCQDSSIRKIPDPSDENNFLEKDCTTGIWFAARTELCDDEEYARYRFKRMQLSKKELTACGLKNEFIEFMEPAPLT
jgi:hypothetical protein